MGCNRRVASKNTVITNLDASGNSYASSNKTPFTDFYVMSNMNKIVHFRIIPYFCFPYGAPINSTICSNFYILTNNNTTILGYFIMKIFFCYKTKTITANYSTAMYNHVTTNDTILINIHIRI